MKNIVSIIIIFIAISLTSCKKEDVTIVPDNKSNFVLLDKTVKIDGVVCYQYKNISTGQIIYEEVKQNNSAKASTYQLKGEKTWLPNVGWSIVCNLKGDNCRIGSICVDGQTVDVIVLKPGTKIN